MFDWEDIVIRIVCVLLVVGLVALAYVGIMACIPQMTEGVVIDKEFTAAHTTTHTTFIRSGKVNVPSIRTVRHPDVWRIQVSGTTKDGKQHTEWWNIGVELYNSIEVGDFVVRDIETSLVSLR